MCMRIYYKKGYKYQLVKTFTVHTDIKGYDIDTRFMKLDEDGLLTIRPGYAWDGPSGPAIDTKNFMRGSLAHDALYQLMRLGFLEIPCRELADKLLVKLCREDGMSRIRAWWVYKTVRAFAGPAASQKNKKEVITAP